MTTPISAVTWVGLLITPLLIAVGQVLFKLTSARVEGFNLAGMARIMSDPLLLIAFSVYGIGTLVWIFVLKSVPLAIAYSFMALTFCFVPLLAVLILGEAIDTRFAVGTALIIAGVLVIHV